MVNPVPQGALLALRSTLKLYKIPTIVSSPYHTKPFQSSHLLQCFRSWPKHILAPVQPTLDLYHPPYRTWQNEKQGAKALLQHNQAHTIPVSGTEYTQICVHIQEQLQKEANFHMIIKHTCCVKPLMLGMTQDSAMSARIKARHLFCPLPFLIPWLRLRPSKTSNNPFFFHKAHYV